MAMDFEHVRRLARLVATAFATDNATVLAVFKDCWLVMMRSIIKESSKGLGQCQVEMSHVPLIATLKNSVFTSTTNQSTPI